MRSSPPSSSDAQLEDGLLRDIRDAVQQAAALAHHSNREFFLEVVRLLKMRFPSWQSPVAFTYNEYDVRIDGLERLRTHSKLLGSLAPANLCTAPEEMALVPVGEEYGVLITRYRIPVGEYLVPLDASGIEPSTSAQDDLLKDMNALAQRGLVHTYARGTYHWLVSSRGTRLVLNGWESVQEASEGDGERMVLRVRAMIANYIEGLRRAQERNRIRQVFGVPRVLLPVVHPVSWDEALRSVEVATAAGVRGIFLINQGLDAKDVLRLVLEVRRRYPKLWVGLNLLGYSPAQALAAALAGCEGRIDGIWSDNAEVAEDAEEQPQAQEFVDARLRHGWNGLYFGGVAFKYQREVPAEKLSTATRTAASFMDVVCTSGPGTGKEANPEKLRAMRSGIGSEAALALASGVTTDNVNSYLPFVDAYLVGTGIEKSFGELDPDKVAALQEQIGAYGT